MLRTLPLADEQILPQAKQESYFFNRIGQEQTIANLAPKRTSPMVITLDSTQPTLTLRSARSGMTMPSSESQQERSTIKHL